MRVGVFRRLGSFLFDAMPIILLLSVLFSLFVGDLLKPDDYDNIYAEYQDLREQYLGSLEQAYLNEEITLVEYQEQYNEIYPEFQEATEEHYAYILVFMSRVVLYHFISFIVIYFVYMAFMKGRTLGRRILKIELGGKVTFWTIFVREFVWKLGYWSVTIGAGLTLVAIGYFYIGIPLAITGVLADLMLITFSKRKQTLRDIVSGTYIKYEGVDYPF